MIRQIHHVAILTSNIEAAIDHYVRLIGCERREPTEIVKPGVRWRSVLMPIGNQTTALQIIEPLEGPGVEELQRGGEGALFEIGFACEDAQSYSDFLNTNQIQPSDLTETPIDSSYMTSSYGNRFFIVPKSQSRGTRLEFVQFCDS